jgi:hypothetical protein
MRVVVAEDKILEAEIVNAFYRAVQLHSREWPESTRQLLVRLVEMVLVKVQVPEGVNEFAGSQIAHLRHHHREHCIRREVERDAKKQIRAALIKLAAQLAVAHVELKSTWQGGNAILSISATFHALTINRRLSGFRFISR